MPFCLYGNEVGPHSIRVPFVPHRKVYLAIEIADSIVHLGQEREASLLTPLHHTLRTILFLIDQIFVPCDTNGSSILVID
jgi:hypothetical protein